jgi:hypothetical protein
MIRTKVCRHQSERGFCAMNSQGKCTFAHTMEELSPVVCFYNERCVNERCTRFHPALGEPMSYYMQKNNITFPVISVPAVSPVVSSPVSAVNTKGTKPCRHATCLMRSECTFAHSIEELNPIPCVYNDRCVNERCTRFHPAKGETIQQYADKNAFVFQSNEEKEIPAEQRFIIRFDPEDQDDVEIVYVYEDEEDEDILDILRREDGDIEEDEEFIISSSPSLESLIRLVPDGVEIPRTVHLLPYDKACDVMVSFLEQNQVNEVNEMLNNMQICA